MEELFTSGFSPDMFAEGPPREIWTFMARHLIRYKQQPSLQAVRSEFPNYELPQVDDALGYLKDQFLVGLKRRKTRDALEEIARAADDPELAPNIDQIFLEHARQLSQLIPTSQVFRLHDMEERIKLYEEEAASGAPTGIQMGIPAFDEETFGIQPHEYVTISGWQGTGKSTLAQWMLLNAYLAGETPMYCSLEMEQKALFRKWDVMITSQTQGEISYKGMKGLQLSDKELKLWKKAAEDVGKRKNDIIVTDDVRSCTVDSIYAQMNERKPSIVCIDYITLMDVHRGKDSSMWERVTYLTNQLKQVSRSLKIPIIGVAQTNANSATEGATLSNISYSRSIGQDSDLVLGLWCDDEMRENHRMQVRLLKNRDGAIRTSDLSWNMDKMKFRPWKEGDMFQRKAAT